MRQEAKISVSMGIAREPLKRISTMYHQCKVSRRVNKGAVSSGFWKSSLLLKRVTALFKKGPISVRFAGAIDKSNR